MGLAKLQRTLQFRYPPQTRPLNRLQHVISQALETSLKWLMHSGFSLRRKSMTPSPGLAYGARSWASPSRLGIFNRFLQKRGSKVLEIRHGRRSSTAATAKRQGI